MAASAAESSDAAWEAVLRSDALANGARKCVRLTSGRGVLLIRHAGVVRCMDHACYHHGGPLLHGDIEDLGGHACIVCPWHTYKIDIDTGEGVYVGLDPVALKEGRREGTVRTKGVKQRVHEAVESVSNPETAELLKTSHVWVRESAPMAVRAAVREEAEREGLSLGAVPRAGPGASGGRSSVRSGSAISSAPKIHSSAPWLASSGGERTGASASAVRSGISGSAPAASVAGGSGGGASASAAAFKKPAKARRTDAPEGWMPSDDYATLTF